MNPERTEVRTRVGALVGWREPIATLGGVSKENAWGICRECGKRITLVLGGNRKRGERPKSTLPDQFARHRASRWGGRTAEKCEAPIHVWLLHQGDKIAAEVGYRLPDIRKVPPWKSGVTPAEQDARLDSIVGAEGDRKKRHKALVEPFLRAYGEAWPARYWRANHEHISAEWRRAYESCREALLYEAAEDVPHETSSGGDSFEDLVDRPIE